MMRLEYTKDYLMELKVKRMKLERYAIAGQLAWNRYAEV